MIARPLQRRRGLSLIESIISLVIVSSMLIAAVGTIGIAKAAEVHAKRRTVGRLLAETLLAEILLHPYEDPSGTSGLGRDAGESADDRATFDDVDDYTGWIRTPPVDRDGTPIEWAGGYTRSVAVLWVDPNDVTAPSVSDTGVKRVIVQTRFDGRVLASLEAMRTAVWPGAGTP